MNRRDFFKYFLLLGAGAAAAPLVKVFTPPHILPAKGSFSLWQIPLSQTPVQGNSYIFCTKTGKVVVMDGGVQREAGYLRGFLGLLGNEVEAWFISHPHLDHIGAFNEILKKPDGLTIKAVYHSELLPEFYKRVEPEHQNLTVEFYRNLKKSGISVTDVTEPGVSIEIDGTTFKILDVKDESVTVNAYNNSSMVIRVEDAVRSVVFLADAGIEQGNRLLHGPFSSELNCDFLQMAHHGQKGVSLDFYRTIRFGACLWPTPQWLWNNDAGKGYNTGPWETIIVRNLMNELGIKKHFISWQGLSRIV
ncbi:MAG TPA: hypothetical protein DEB25_00430 [Desulfobulbaceae bacterium]|nr:hypothetical protein [Desulfobulbaceae bacterium]